MQRLHQIQIASLFLLGGRLREPGVRRPLHVDDGVERGQAGDW